MRKIAKTCEGCHEPVRARYRTQVDRYLCDPCWVEDQQAQASIDRSITELRELRDDEATEAIRLAFEAQWEGSHE